MNLDTLSDCKKKYEALRKQLNYIDSAASKVDGYYYRKNSPVVYERVKHDCNMELVRFKAAYDSFLTIVNEKYPSLLDELESDKDGLLKIYLGVLFKVGDHSASGDCEMCVGDYKNGYNQIIAGTSECDYNKMKCRDCFVNKQQINLSVECNLCSKQVGVIKYGV